MDAAIANYLFGDYFYEQYGLTKTPIVFNAVPLFYATAKGRNGDLLVAIDRHLDTWLVEPGSVYYQTLGRYTAQVPRFEIPPWVRWAVSAALAAIVLSIFVIGLLRWQVGVKTANLVKANEELAHAYDSTIEGWSRVLDFRDHETEGHTRRVTEMTLRLARKSGMSEEQLVHVKRGALLHDIGKLGVPDCILLKPSSLTEDEWKTMRRHPEYAEGMLAEIEYLAPALEIPSCHHERWDGTGYPRGLKGRRSPGRRGCSRWSTSGMRCARTVPTGGLGATTSPGNTSSRCPARISTRPRWRSSCR